MNVIIGLLTLQSEMMDNQESQNILNDAADRLKSMNLLYDKLYLPGNEKTISLKEFLPSFINEVISIFPVTIPIEVKTEIDDITLSNTAVTPVIIILNELITNSMKHAFSGSDSGIISVTALLRDNRISFIYEDNGIGLPPDFTLEDSTGFGAQLVSMLAEQIGGTVKTEPGKGVKFILEWDYILPVAEDN